MEMNGLVLVLDPDPSSRERLRIRLESVGLKVTGVGDLPEALKAVQATKPQLVISEWEIKPHQGTDIAKALVWPLGKLVFFTSRDLATLPVEALQMTSARLFHKNDRMGLLDHLDTILGDSRRPQVPRMVPSLPTGQEFLLIDDSATVRMVLRKALLESFAGCAVREAEDGHTALSQMGQKHVDAIVTDLEMPGMDGRDFLKRILANPVLKKKPVLVFSGQVDNSLVGSFSDYPNVSFLRKPCDPPVLVEALRRQLAKGEKVGLGER